VGPVSASVTIGEFSRLTHLTVKTLRHYHEQGLLVPYAVDQASGYRRYAVEQVPDALLIGRLRRLDMPLAEVRRVLDSPDTVQRDAAIAHHLARMEAELSRTRAIVASLRGLLIAPIDLDVERRSLPALTAVAVTARVERDAIDDWCAQAFPALYSRLDGPPTGPGGALYSGEFFTEAAGEVTAFVPVTGGPQRIAGGDYAVAVHAGPFVDVDRTYAALGSHVAAYETAAPGPIREIYLVSPPEITDDAFYRTEVCWPITY
jgi:DNA-binding transcriptional MerR regulator